MTSQKAIEAAHAFQAPVGDRPGALPIERQAVRARHIGGSEVAALFGADPRTTLFEIWHRKRGTLPPVDLSDNDRVFWGTILEPAIARGAAELCGWTVRKVRRHIAHPGVAGMGASLDYEIVSHERGPGCLEIKAVDWLVFRDQWEDGEPPLHIELQLQCQMACTGRSWGAIAALIGGNDLRVYERARRPATIERIEVAVAAFWQSVADGIEPKPDFARDGEAIAALYRDAAEGKVVDLAGDNRFPDLCAEYQRASAAEKAASEAKDAAKAEMMVKIGDAERAICGPYSVSAKTVAGGPVSYERKPYRSFRLTEKKEKAAS